MTRITTLFLSFYLIIFSCEDTNLTGSENVSEIDNVTFSNISTSISNNTLIASGTITNNNQSLSISPPWYIECQYYYNNTSGNTFLIGGESTLISNALPAGVSLNWTLEHQVDNPDNYSNFTINDLRAYKN
jgi:hypothetical protein